MNTTYKLSQYLVRADSNQNVLLFSTRSAEQISISKQLYNKFIEGNFSNLSIEDLNLFQTLKIIVKKEVNEFNEVMNLSKEKSKDSSVLNYIIIPSASCPLGCNLDDFGGYCGQEHTSKKMTSEIQQNVISGIKESILPSHKKMSISWFGAEPLTGLSIMKNISLSLIDIAKEKGIEYYSDLVTGGTLLTLNVARDCYLKYKINSFNVTLDGPQTIHDQRRCTKGGKPTFEIILNNLSNIINDPDLCQVKLSVRCNVDSRNIEHVHELIDIIAEKGWQKRVELYFVAVHSWGTHENRTIKLTAEKYAQYEIGLLKKMQNLGFKPFLLPNIKPVVCRVVADSRSVIGHDGNIHKCTETPLTKTFYSYDVSEMEVSNLPSTKKHDYLGTVFERKLTSQDDIWNWHGALEKNKFPCTTCEFLPTCGGSCPLSWMNGVAQCPSYKFNMQDRMLLFEEKSLKTFSDTSWSKPTIEDLQFTPLNLIKEYFTDLSAAAIENLNQFENYLKSSRIKAKLGNFILSDYQIKQAQSIKLKIGINLPLRYLLNATEKLTIAYLEFKQGKYKNAQETIFEVFEDLNAAKRNFQAIEVLPALIQTAINLATIESAEGKYSLITLLKNYLTTGEGFVLNHIGFKKLNLQEIEWPQTLNNFLNSLVLMENKVLQIVIQKEQIA